MKYIDLINKIKDPIFSLQDLRLLHLKIYPYQLSQWTQKKYLIKLKNGLYLIKDRQNEVNPEIIAFYIYQPSYISLEWALSKYGIIPEMVYSPTSVTTKTTRFFKNKITGFIYRHIKKDLFFGFKKVQVNKQIYLIAEAEKAILDYIYLNKNKIKNNDDVVELRWNKFEFNKLDNQKINEFLKLMPENTRKQIQKTLTLIKKYI